MTLNVTPSFLLVVFWGGSVELGAVDASGTTPTGKASSGVVASRFRAPIGWRVQFEETVLTVRQNAGFAGAGQNRCAETNRRSRANRLNSSAASA